MPLTTATHTGNGNAFVWSKLLDAELASVDVRVRVGTSFGVVEAAFKLEQSAPDIAPGSRSTVGLCGIMYPSDVHLLRAWSAYWELLGVDEFFLYWRGPPEKLSELEDVAKQLKHASVTFIQWGNVSRLPQQVSLNSCWRRFGRAHTYLMNYDLDEYLVLEPMGVSIADFFDALKPATWAAVVSDSNWAELDYAAINTTYDRMELRHLGAAPFKRISQGSGGRVKWTAHMERAFPVAPLVDVHELFKGDNSGHPNAAPGPGGLLGDLGPGAEAKPLQYFIPRALGRHFHLANAKQYPRDVGGEDMWSYDVGLRSLVMRNTMNVSAAREKQWA